MVSVMCRIDDIEAPDPRLHPATPTHRAAVFFDLGVRGSRGGEVTLWGYDAAAFRRVAEACSEAARQLDAAIAEAQAAQASAAEESEVASE